MQRTQIFKTILKENTIGRFTLLPHFETYYKVTFIIQCSFDARIGNKSMEQNSVQKQPIFKKNTFGC